PVRVRLDGREVARGTTRIAGGMDVKRRTRRAQDHADLPLLVNNRADVGHVARAIVALGVGDLEVRRCRELFAGAIAARVDILGVYATRRPAHLVAGVYALLLPDPGLPVAGGFGELQERIVWLGCGAAVQGVD